MRQGLAQRTDTKALQPPVVSLVDSPYQNYTRFKKASIAHLHSLAGLFKKLFFGYPVRIEYRQNQNPEYGHDCLDKLHALSRLLGPHPACAPLRRPSPTRVGEGSRVRAVGKLPCPAGR